MNLELAVSETPGSSSSSVGITGAHCCAWDLRGSFGSELWALRLHLLTESFLRFRNTILNYILYTSVSSIATKFLQKTKGGKITEILGFKICSGEEITMLLILYKLGNLFLVCSPCSGPGTAPLCGLGPGCRVNPACILKGKLLSPASGV